jgi:formate dehydrogenase
MVIPIAAAEIVTCGAPPGVRVCTGLSCALAGADGLLAQLPSVLGAGLAVTGAACLGRCDGAPAVLADGRPVTGADAAAVLAAVAANAANAAPAAHPDHVGYDAYRAAGGYGLLRDCADGRLDPESVIVMLMASRLRGLGGGGEPTGRKWRAARNAPVAPVLAVDVGVPAPGTFKDRHYLERDPHRFLEGVFIAAWAIDTDTILLTVGPEFPDLAALLADELARLRADPPVPDLPHVVSGAACAAGAAAAVPTLAHNPETLYWVPDILGRGAEWFAARGRHGRRGLRSFSVSGRVREPGVKLVPAGTTMRELLDEHCGGMQDGHAFYAYRPGGTGVVLPAALADVPLDFDTLERHGSRIGAGAIVVLSDRDVGRAAALGIAAVS